MVGLCYRAFATLGIVLVSIQFFRSKAGGFSSVFFLFRLACLPCLLLGRSYNFSAKQEFIEHCHDVSMRVIAGLVMFCVFGFFFSMQLGSFKDVIPELREVVTGAWCFGGHIV